MKALLVFCTIGVLGAQDLITKTPEVSVYEGDRMWSRFVWKYLPRDMPHTQYYNSNRLNSSAATS